MEGGAVAGAAEAVGYFAPETFTGLELVARFVWSIFLMLASTMGAVAYTYKFEFEIQMRQSDHILFGRKTDN